MMKIKSTPKSIVENSKFNFGLYKREFENLNIEEAKLFNGIVTSSKAFHRFRLKEWQHFGIIHPDYYIGFVVMDAKFLGLSFFYVYDRHTHTITEHKADTFFRTLGVANNLYRGHTYFFKRGYQLEINNMLSENRHQVKVSIKKKYSLPKINGEFVILEDQTKYEPAIPVLRFPKTGMMYTHKNVCPVEGSLNVGDKEIKFDPSRDFAMIDVQKSFYPYNSFWSWMAGGGYDSAGNFIAFNLTKNIIKNDEEQNENCIWLNGKPYPCGAVFPEYGDSPMNTWKINTSCNSVKLSFVPENQRKQKINLGIFKSDFHQPLGMFTGILTPDNQPGLQVSLFGIAEHHTMKW